MGNSAIPEILRQVPFFTGMDEPLLDLIAGCASERHAGHGHYLFFEGDPADHFYFVLEGKVALQMNAGSLGLFTIETLEANEMIGWSWMYPPYRWTLTGRSVGITRLLDFDARCLRGHCETSKDLTYALMKRTATVSATRLLAARLALTENLV